MTAEEFAEQRYDLPDGGRWSELVSGEPVILGQPSDAHGNIVRNLSSALAEWIDKTRIGYACFELGLIVQRAPDTVYCPAISYFVIGNRWAEMDNVVTETRPAVVVEVASTTDRRRSMRGRVELYRAAGVAVVIVIDPQEKQIAVHSGKDGLEVLGTDDTLAARDEWRCDDLDQPLLEGFSISLEAVFQHPEWWDSLR